MSLRVMHVFITQLRPHNARHLNALYLPQFLSHLSLKTSHTPTFKPTACCSAQRRLPCCDIIWWYNCRAEEMGGGSQWEIPRLRRAQYRHFLVNKWANGVRWRKGGVYQHVLDKHWGEEWKESSRRRRKGAKSHIWRHHGGSAVWKI